MSARWTPGGLLAFWQTYGAQRRHLGASPRQAARTAWRFGPVKPTRREP